MAFKNLADHLLINECQAGNVKAFDILFERYFNKLHFFALRYLQNDRELAEELVMDMMTRLWEKKDGFTTEADLGPYLFRSLKNLIIDHYRKKSLRTISLEQSHEDLFLTGSADSHIVLNELQNNYRSRLEELSPQRRLVFEMSREHQMTYPEIAKGLNLSVKTVESHISAALAYLRKNLQRHSDTFALFVMLHFFI